MDDIDAARAELVERGANVSELFHYAGLPFNDSMDKPRISGRDAEGRSYLTFISFDDPDRNRWLVQEITTRLPGREWEQNATRASEVGTIAQLLRETSEHHDGYEKTHAEHHWWDWYAPYFSARQNGSSSEQALASADRYMDKTFHVPAK